MSVRFLIIVTISLMRVSSAQTTSTDTLQGYLIGVQERGGEYFHNISAHRYYGNVIEDGELGHYEASQLFFGYDSSVIGIDSLLIKPKCVGSTKLFLRNPEALTSIADSIEVIITKRGSKLRLTTRRAP